MSNICGPNCNKRRTMKKLNIAIRHAKPKVLVVTAKVNRLDMIV